MTFPEFIALVMRLRQAHKDYYRTKNSAELAIVIRIEREVDVALKQLAQTHGIPPVGLPLFQRE